MKKVLLMVLTLALLASALVLPTAAAIAPGNTVSPLWTNTSHVDYLIGFVDGVGYADGTTTAKATPKNISIDIYVYVQTTSGWQYVTEAHMSKTGMAAGLSCPFTAVSGAYYKAEYTFTLSGNGIDEVITPTAYKTCP